MKKFKKALSALTAVTTLMTAAAGGAGSLGTAAAETKTAVELVQDMGLGWNLGNTFDCWGTNWSSGNATADSWETSWGNAKTTQEMITEIHNYGFNSVRIPITWYKATDPTTFDINDDYLARIKEVIDYCYNEDMYVIINMHWDWVDPSNNANLWLNKGLSAETQFKTMWKEIATYFKSYDNHLVFEDMNEVWWENNYTSSASASYTTLNTLNQDFVDVVRATGGNNADRLLVLAGANADLTKTCNSAYIVPDDDMVAVDIHYYTPANFCVRKASDSWGTNQTTWGTASDKSDMLNALNKLKTRFIDSGTPVIIGEYGVLTNEGKDQASIEEFVKTMAEYAKGINGMSSFLWDDSDSGGHKYFSRKNLTWFDETIGKNFSTIAGTDYEAPKVDWVETELVDDNGVLKFQIGNSTKVKLVFDSEHAATLGAGGTISYWDMISNSNKQDAVSISVGYNELTGELLANELGEEDADGNREVVHTGYIAIPGDVAPANAYIQLYWAGYNEFSASGEYIGWNNLTEEDFPELVKVYIDGVVDNDEPETTTTTEEPVVTTTTTAEPETTTTTTAAEPETTTTTSEPSDVTYGDANGDKTVSVADATLIMQSIANPNTFTVTDPVAADCSGSGDGITSGDALAIQKHLANSDYALPVA